VSDSRPLVLIDVDGVVNRALFLSSRQRNRLLYGRPYGTNKTMERGWVHTWAGDRHYGERIVTHPKYGQWLTSLADRAELAWATLWTEAANWHISPLLGLPELRCSPFSDKGVKAVHAVAFTDGRPWAWLEDKPEELELASALSKGRPHHAELVDSSAGLVRENVDWVSAWLDSLG